MSECGRITQVIGSYTGSFDSVGCCNVPFRYILGPGADGWDDDDDWGGAGFRGRYYNDGGGGGGGGGSWDGGGVGGGSGSEIGDDGDDDPFDPWAKIGGGGSGIGDDDDEPGCLVYGTLILLADGRKVAVEDVQPGWEVASLDVFGMERDGINGCQYRWSRAASEAALNPVPAKVDRVSRSYHDGHYVINHRICATFEHPFLVRRGSVVGFVSADRLRPDDVLLRPDGTNEEVFAIGKVQGLVKTANLHVAGTNIFSASDVWVHNASISGPPGVGGGGGNQDGDVGGKTGGASV